MDIRTVHVGGQALRVGIRRGAPNTVPLLLFNGIGAGIEFLRPLMNGLEERGCIIFDVPGIGESPAPALPFHFIGLARMTSRLLAVLGIDGPVDVLGYSWGGSLAQQFTLQYPRQCRRLVLVAATAGIVMVPGPFSSTLRMLNPGAVQPKDLDHDAERAERHMRDIKLPSGIGYRYQLLAAMGWTSVPWLHTLRQRALVMSGTTDVIVPPANGRLLARLLPRAELFEIEGGHIFVVARLDAVLPKLLAFVRQVDP